MESGRSAENERAETEKEVDFRKGIKALAEDLIRTT